MHLKLSSWINHVLPTIDCPAGTRCYICNGKVSGTFYYDRLGHYVCDKHSDLCTCFACTGICSTSNSIEVPGYGHICPECARKVIDPVSATKLVDYVHNVYKGMGMSFPGHQLRLVSIDEMMQLTSNHGNVHGLAIPKINGIYHVCVLKHISKVAFAGVFAHEILHLWQFGKHIDPPGPICEGFCNLGEYIVLSTINKTEAKARMSDMLTNVDPTYGEGFRTLKVEYDRSGWRGVLKLIEEFKH